MRIADDTWQGAMLDSFALLDYLQDGEGAPVIEQMLSKSTPTRPRA